jgi:DNA polymerase-3 subunit delta'
MLERHPVMTTILGHDAVLERLRHSVIRGSHAHAYLFSGKEGIGKRLVARETACMLNCPEEQPEPGCLCRTCTRIRNGNYPDVLLLTPDRNIIRIDQIRNLQEFFHYPPIEGRNRIAIIDDAHTMNTAAQNALLKVLEEPPPRRALILVSSSPALLLPTVRSRCRKIRFSPVPIDAVAARLETELRSDSAKAAAVASMTGGSFAKAYDIISSDFPVLRELVISFLENPGRHGTKGLLELSAKISEDRRTALDAIDIAESWIRDLLAISIQGPEASVINIDFFERLHRLAEHYPHESLLEAEAELSRAAELIGMDINVNKTLATDVMLLRTARILAGPTFGVVYDDREKQ